jgi:hypothetical protein
MKSIIIAIVITAPVLFAIGSYSANKILVKELNV